MIYRLARLLPGQLQRANLRPSRRRQLLRLAGWQNGRLLACVFAGHPARVAICLLATSTSMLLFDLASCVSQPGICMPPLGKNLSPRPPAAPPPPPRNRCRDARKFREESRQAGAGRRFGRQAGGYLEPKKRAIRADQSASVSEPTIGRQSGRPALIKALAWRELKLMSFGSGQN